MRLPIDLSTIPEKDIENPTVLLLLDIMRFQTEQLEQLKDEINKLKNHPRKLNIRPSRFEKKGTAKSQKNKSKKAGS